MSTHGGSERAAVASVVGAVSAETSLDPQDWHAFRAQAHRMLDDILDFTRDLRERPVWTPPPEAARERFRAPLPMGPSDLAAVHSRFLADILPYAACNAHPAFMGWVQGGGTPVGMLADMLAAGLNANLGGRDQMPLEVERQVVRWMRELFGFPQTASGLFVTGTSIANLMAVLIARHAALGAGVRDRGLAGTGTRLVGYTSAGAHGCVAQAFDLAGLGRDALRRVPVDAGFAIDVTALKAAIAADRAAGFVPFLVVGTAGSVDVGAIDDLGSLADLCERESLWLHIDGAFGALARLAPSLAPRLAGVERADSIAFDFHKWGQVPYDAGFLLVRDGRQHQDTFAAPAAYLRRESRGLAGGSPWPCDFGPDLSRGFRALKTWFTFQVYGAAAIGRSIEHCCAVARRLAERVEAEPALELLAPVALNIVCFRHRADASDSDALNAEIVVALQTSGVCAPSSTTVNGRLAIRAAIVNHRTVRGDVDRLVEATLALGRRLRPTRHAVVLGLLEGGDERLAIVPATGRNRYGCAPWPEPAVASFSSSTATSISARALRAAERLHRWLAVDDGADRRRRAAECVVEALKRCGGIADLPRIGVVLSPSGTDLHRLAAERIAAHAGRPPLVLMMEAAETGSGVAAALSHGTEVRQIALRLGDGRPRAIEAVDGDVAAEVDTAVADGRRVLVVALDVSKTGLAAPSPAALAALRQRHGTTVQVLVDACQFRMAPSTLRRHLLRGATVAVTGSKFLTGPSFSGALLVPGDPPPAGTVPSAGVLLRWSAALAEYRAFLRVPPSTVVRLLDVFAAAVRLRIEGDPAFEVLPAGPLVRENDGWDSRPTIFPFLLRRRLPDGRSRYLDRDETRWVHEQLLHAPGAARCQLGQPVASGHRDGVAVAALRLCVGARDVVEAASAGERGPQAWIDRAHAVLDRCDRLVADLPPRS